ncbi:MAG TPA: ComEC/Rec2 family competence protein [Bacillota bacterium]|nr:ComEC/Rec2 family competence protein [Bacillota bacterium]
MRRPVVFLFLFFIFGIALEYHLSRPPFQLAAMALLPAVILFIFQAVRSVKISGGVPRARTGFICLFLLTALLGSLYFYLAEHHSDPLEFYEGKTFTVEGRVVTVKVQSESSWQMLITAPGADKRLVQVKGTMKAPEEYIGKWAVVRGKVELPSERRNPGLFDYRLYLKTKGVRVILLTDPGHISIGQGHAKTFNGQSQLQSSLSQGESLFFSSLARLKYGFMDRLSKEMSPDAYGLMVGMLFGDRSFIGDDVYEAFQKNGIAHILSVSGIHVGIVYLYLSRLFGSRKTRGVYLLSALMRRFRSFPPLWFGPSS